MTNHERIQKIDFPMFFGEYPFQDKKIVESKILSSPQGLSDPEALEDVIEQAKELGFHAITHVQLQAKIGHQGSSGGNIVWCNAIKLT